MIADLAANDRKAQSQLAFAVVLLGPAVQFKGRLPSMLMRAHLRQAEARPDDLRAAGYVSRSIAKMKAALPAHDEVLLRLRASTRSARRGNARSRSTAAFRWHGTTRI